MNAFSEINIFSYTVDEFDRALAVYLRRGFEVKSCNSGIVRMFKGHNHLDQWIHIYTPVGIGIDTVNEIIDNRSKEIK